MAEFFIVEFGTDAAEVAQGFLADRKTLIDLAHEHEDAQWLFYPATATEHLARFSGSADDGAPQAWRSHIGDGCRHPTAPAEAADEDA